MSPRSFSLPSAAMLTLRVALVEQEVGETEKSTVKADCGTQRYLVKDPGTTFDCQVATTSGAARAGWSSPVKDVEGSVDRRLA